MTEFSLKRAVLDINIGTIIMGLILFLLFLITFRSTVKPSDPFVVKSAVGVGYRTHVGTVFEYQRELEVKTPFSGMVTNTVICGDGLAFEAPLAYRMHSAGSRNHKRAFFIPHRYPSNDECTLISLLAWTPPLSLTQYVYEVGRIKVSIAPVEHDDIGHGTHLGGHN